MQRLTTAMCLDKLDASPEGRGIVIDADGKWNWANIKPATNPAPVVKNTPNSFTFGWHEDKLKYEALGPSFDHQVEGMSSKFMSAGKSVKPK